MKNVVSWKSLVIAMGTVLLVSSCVRGCKPGREEMSPEQVVEAYLDTALNITDVTQRATLLQYTTGPLKAAIASASDDTLKAAYIDRKYKIERFSIVERRNRTPLVVEVSFRMVFQDLTQRQPGAKPEDSAKITTENTVAVVKEKHVWLIRDIIGAKTAIDFFTPMTIKAGEKDPEPPQTDGLQP